MTHGRISQAYTHGRALIAALSLCAITGGCEKPLLSDNEERSQFDRYDAVRSQLPPPYIEDEFGRQRPNLRGRLLPRQ